MGKELQVFKQAECYFHQASVFSFPDTIDLLGKFSPEIMSSEKDCVFYHWTHFDIFPQYQTWSSKRSVAPPGATSPLGSVGGVAAFATALLDAPGAI